MTRAYVGLGANLGDRAAMLRAALEQLAAEPGLEVVAVSPVRETEPVGYHDQPRFLNAAAAVETELPPRELLDRLLGIERRLGRTREGPRFGPRTIDLDLLLYGDEQIDEPGLEVPHPRLHERLFVLEPLLELDPGLVRSRARAAGEILARATIGVMSHLDELDEFEAELELQLKKEYSAVFPLFRYCVLTQDATYLCNKVDLQPRIQPTYPFFQVKMEDVWVWDKNRPSRIIPRTRIFTSGDVTVEELRGEGEEPTLTAEALAERIGETLGSDDDS